MAGTTIKSGSSGPDVTEWQGMLAAAGYPVPATGTFDAATDKATRAWQASRGLVADGVVGPASWAAMQGKPAPKTFPAYYAKDAAFGRQVLLAVWPEVTGQQPTLAELQIAGAQAHLESAYGKSSYKLLDHSSGATLATSGPINNWGAVQTSKGPPEGFLATDTSPLKATADNPKGYYDHHYRVYPTPEEGARHFVEHMTVKRPTSWARMREGDVDAWAQQMWAGKLPSGALNRDPLPPVGSPEIDPKTGKPPLGMLGYFEQKPGERAKGVEQRIWAIADALGEPVAAGRGGPYTPPAPADGGGFLPSLEPRTPGQRGFMALLAAAVAGGLGYLAWRYRPWTRFL